MAEKTKPLSRKDYARKYPLEEIARVTKFKEKKK
jgi:hypothetical protein